MTVRDNDIIVCCRGDENDDGSGHPLIYLYKEGSETFCPYCNRLMSEEFKFEESEKFKSNEESKSVAGCIVKVFVQRSGRKWLRDKRKGFK